MRVSVWPSGATSNVCEIPWRPSTSASRTRLPSRVRASAMAAATVVLPVPPLPVTTCSRTFAIARWSSVVASGMPTD